MRRYKIPACYFPSTIVFVDDNSQQLKSLNLGLDGVKFVPRFFSNSRDALDFLKKYQPSSFVQRCLLRSHEVQLDHLGFDIDVPSIREEIYNPNRFSEISIAVIDYAMPGINGLQLCEQLQDKSFKKLMLTGEADEIIAVKAFNEGVIDKFIRKDAVNFHELINRTIQELQQQYFQELSAPIVASLITSSEDNIESLDDPVFANLFYDFCKEKNISEYYLVDSFGSFLLLNDNENPSWLAVKDEIGMQVTYEIAKSSGPQFSQALLDSIQKREKIYYLYESDFSDDYKEYEKYTYPAKTIKGKTTYYYAYIDNPDTYDIQRSRISSYKDFLEKSIHQTF